MYKNRCIKFNLERSKSLCVRLMLNKKFKDLYIKFKYNCMYILMQALNVVDL